MLTAAVRGILFVLIIIESHHTLKVRSLMATWTINGCSPDYAFLRKRQISCRSHFIIVLTHHHTAETELTTALLQHSPFCLPRAGAIALPWKYCTTTRCRSDIASETLRNHPEQYSAYTPFWHQRGVFIMGAGWESMYVHLSACLSPSISRWRKRFLWGNRWGPKPACIQTWKSTSGFFRAPERSRKHGKSTSTRKGRGSTGTTASPKR